ncbi:DUF2201 family putative metallopeptidase [Nocardia transvalensis]|uniref:vWA domain-containing protein n=1 Tax=Nocardia transvalensis TaxID=37333 RepID=UPI001894B485|nr:VWA-like domain-containing protein [Nocardia transvalensis]MBF6333512.1 hypothetical protein [Nocardia transvalensis]
MTEIRPLNPAEREAFQLARLVVVELRPYFAVALFAIRPVAAPELGTFGVDERWRLYLDPDLLVGPCAWSPDQAGAALLHEVGHLIRAHADRARDVAPQPVSEVAWNYAADAEINDDLLAAGIHLPDGVITPDMLGCEPGGVAEDYYEAVRPPDTGPATAPPDPMFGDEPGCGSGAGCRAQSWEQLPIDSAEGLTPADADLVRRDVAVAVRDAAATGRGTVPAGLTRWASETLAPPQVPWNRLLRTALRRVVANKAGCTHPTYTRPSRRNVPGVILPALRAVAVRVTLVVDTSGSMSPSDLDTALAEISGILRSTGIDRDNIRVLACDAASTEPQRVRSVADIQLVGGGGTDMRVGITAATTTRPTPHVVVVLTDGYTPWPTSPTRAQLICVIIGNPHATPPPWAMTVHVPTGASNESRSASAVTR